jgi:hypothetical protein
MTSVELKRTRIGEFNLDGSVNSRKIEEMGWDTLGSYIK